MKDFIDAAKAKPGELKQSGGSLTARDSIMRQVLQNATGARWAFISFPGGGERIAALLGGHVDMMIVEPQEARREPARGQDARARASGRQAAAGVPRRSHAEGSRLRRAAGSADARRRRAARRSPPDVAAYWRDFFQRLVRTPAWRKYLEDNQFEDGFRAGAEFTKTLDDTSKQLRTLLQDVRREAGALM